MSFVKFQAPNVFAKVSSPIGEKKCSHPLTSDHRKYILYITYMYSMHLYNGIAGEEIAPHAGQRTGSAGR